MLHETNCIAYTNPMSKNRASIFITIALLLGLGAGYLVGAGRPAVAPPFVAPETATPAQTVNVLIDYGPGHIDSHPDAALPTDGTVLAALTALSDQKKLGVETKEYTGLGTLVTKIGDTANGTGDAYWQYWVNGRHADVGADVFKLEAGDVVEWKFTTSPE